MDKKSDKSSRELLMYFVLALMFGLLSIPAGRMITLTYFQSPGHVILNLRWVFWLCTTLSILCILPLFRAFFFVLHQRGSLPKSVDWLFTDEVEQRIENAMERLRSKVFSAIGRLVIAGASILVVVMLLFRTGAIHNDEIDSNLYALAHSLKGKYRQEAKFSNVSVLDFIRPHYGEYLPDCLKLVRDLKEAGAKVVLLRLSPETTTPPVDPKEGLRLIRELENTGIVVFGTPYGRDFRYADSAGEIRFSKGTFTVSGHNMEESIDLCRFKPSGMEREYTDPLRDVTLEIIRKYKGYSDHLSPERGADQIRFGDFTIPVTNDGWMFSRDKGFPTGRTLVYVDNKGDWVYWRQQGSMWTSPEVKKAGLAVSTPPLGAMKLLDAEVQGKIVLLAESFGERNILGSSTRAYASAIENILAGTITTKSETGYLWLSVVCVVIAGFIAYRFRMVAAILLMSVLAVCTLLFGSYLYDSQNILLDIFYPLISLAMAMVAFPAIALGRRGQENEVLKEVVK
ncbi:MAG: hypothetical protein NTZ35_09180 [Ignavibacteriales bacterium]|nr:hypothetical protein [Ignavibacteriales bacterium]